MIDSLYSFGTVTIYCDKNNCKSEETFEGFDNKPDFYSAIKEAKEMGWKILNKNGNWEHFCPSCYEKESKI